MKTKTQFTNRILSLVLALVMVLGMMPMTVFASETKEIHIGELSLGDQYTVDGVAAIDGVPDDGVTSYAHWNWATRTLTLKNYTQTITARKYTTNMYYGIGYDGRVNLVIIGDNTITVEAPDTTAKQYTYGIWCHKDLTITGDGSLSVSAPTTAISCNSNIIANCSGKICANANHTGYGLDAGKTVDIQQGTIELYGVRNALSSATLNIANADVEAYSNNGPIEISNDITIKNSSVKAICNWATSYTAYTGIRSLGGSIIIDNSQVEAGGSTGNGSVAGIGIRANNDISIKNSTVSAVAGTGMRFEGSNCVITGSTVNLTSNGIASSSRGIYGNGVSISNSTVTLTSTKAAFNNAPSVDTNKSAAWYGTDSTTAAEAGARPISELSANYTQKYVRIAPYDHTHNWIYSADGDTITATCDAAGCLNVSGGSAILKTTAGSYNGGYIQNAGIEYSDEWVGEKVDNDKIAYTNNLNVGTATAKVMIEGKELTATFEINEADISNAVVSLNPTSGTYNGTAYDPSVSVTLDGFGTLAEGTDYTLSWDKSGFTNADTYTVTVTGKGNFEGTKTQLFKINAANLTDVKVEQVGTLTYTGEAQTPTVSASATSVDGSEITFTYSMESEGPYSAEIPSFTNAGWAYRVFYSATAANHNTYYGSFHVEVEKASVTEPTIANKVYNGSVQTADVADTELYTVVKNEGGTGVKENGYYDVVLELKDPANYKWSTTSNAQVTLPFAITRAENEWAVNPSISGWTYGETAKAPVGEAKFGEVSVQYTGTTNGGAAYNSVAAPTEAGSYTATFIVPETEDYKGLETSVDFTIAKAAQEAPTGIGKEDETIFGRNDGIILNLNTSMEFRKEGETTYSPCTGDRVIDRASGTYYVRYKGSDNYDPSPDTAVTIAAGRKLQIVVPQNQVGYTVTVNKTEMEYKGSYTLKVEIHEGYTATENFKIIISNWECGQQAGVEETYMNAIADQIIEVQGVADITSPDVEINVKENKWTSFLNGLTFGLFFKETQDVTITATDKGSGVKSVQYYLSEVEQGLDELSAITDWQEYNGTFKIDEERRYIIYARVTDNSGNIMCINSDGIILDKTAPMIYGIEEGGKYYGMNVFGFNDEYSGIASLKIDGVETTYAPAEPSIYITPDNAEHTVTVTDMAGNVTEYHITVYKNYTVTFKADGTTVDTQTVGYGKDATLPAIPAKEGFVGKWDAEGKNITNDTTINVVYTEIPVVKPDEVKPEDKSDLEDAKAKLEEMLEDDSYTDDDKKDIQDAIDDIDDALEVIGKVEAVEELIDKLPENITKNDEDAIKAADDAYNALSDYEKSLVDEAAKKALTDAKAALAELNKPADPNAPATGDNSNMFLWIALLFISGGAVITLTVVDRKKRAVAKK